MLLPCTTAGANPGLRVVLMSATADADLFASYFSQRLGEPSGMVNIPGFTHPVKGEQRWAIGLQQGAADEHWAGTNNATWLREPAAVAGRERQQKKQQR